MSSKAVLVFLAAAATAIDFDSDVIVAYFPLAGGVGMDMVSDETCMTPLETETDPFNLEFDSTPDNMPMSTENWKGVADMATKFDGDDWFQCSSVATAMVSGDVDRSVCVWALVDSLDNGAMFTYGERRETCAHYSLRTVINAGLQVQHWGECDIPDIPFNASDVGTTWHYYCLTYDGTTSKLFIDFEVVAEADVALDTGLGAATDFFIGYTDFKFKSTSSIPDNAEGNSNFFSGSMSDLVVASVALTEDEMMELSGIMDTVTDDPVVVIDDPVISDDNGTNTTNMTNMSWY